MPSQAYYSFSLRFTREGGMTERQVRELVESHGFSIANRSAAGRLCATLEGVPAVLELRITPTGD